MSDVKPREWKLEWDGNFDSTGIVREDSGPQIFEAVRVVEKSAYDAVVKERDQLKAEIDRIYASQNG